MPAPKLTTFSTEMSSRSSWSEIFSDLQTAAGVKPPVGPPGFDQDAGERHQPGEALRSDRGLRMVAVAAVGFDGIGAPVGGGAISAARSGDGCGQLRLAGVALDQQLQPLAQLRRPARRGPSDPGVLAEAEHPGDQLARSSRRR